MRLAFLLIAGCILLTCKSSSHLMQVSGKPHDLADLRQYSYLLVRVNAHREGGLPSMNVDNGTGFFVRDTVGRLFLFSALHVFSRCDVLHHTMTDLAPDSLKVWYTDKSGVYTFKELSLAPFMNQPCRTDTPMYDMECMEVTEAFRNIEIHSVETMVPSLSQQFYGPQDGDRIFVYGYSYEVFYGKWPDIGDPACIPICKKSRLIPRDTSFAGAGLYYLFSRPDFYEGFSGAPVFQLSKTRKNGNVFDMVGIQSYSDSTHFVSLISPGSEIKRYLYRNR